MRDGEGIDAFGYGECNIHLAIDLAYHFGKRVEDIRFDEIRSYGGYNLYKVTFLESSFFNSLFLENGSLINHYVIRDSHGKFCGDYSEKEALKEWDDTLIKIKFRI